MFGKILIANRGEIACRVIRTARRLGVRTVAVYSDADAGALHVKDADESARLGPASARESYLSIDKIIAAVRETGAEAVHPGYGFLSENADFAHALEQAGIVFIGPPSSAIRAMGSKSAAKALMTKAGVPLLPGYHGDEQTVARFTAEAAKIGYPVALKAVAGGGGKGIRIVRRKEDLAGAFDLARREALSSFGSEILLLEKFLERPRHIEVQLFADTHNHALHLFDRDCSIQRRHQKVLEEAPAPNLPDAIRAQMAEAALTAARSVGYVGAGTVEFLYEDGKFYFMEMNTRLQVEHPVTEAITGLDLVEWQLRVASGEKLPLAQDQIKASGHAIEVRLCAEDPTRDFMPATGAIEYLAWPTLMGIRVDTGFRAGDRIGIHYDSLLAKVIAYAETRAQAAELLRHALEETHCVGLATNQAFLHGVLEQGDFADGTRLSTGFIAANRDALCVAPASDATHWAAAALIFWRDQPAPETGDPWAVASGWRLNGPGEFRMALRHEGDRETISILESGEALAIGMGGQTLAWNQASVGDGLISIHTGAQVREFRYWRSGDRLALFDGPRALSFFRDDGLGVERGLAASANDVRAPMPGTITALHVAEGQSVKKGDSLVSLEAMKMVHNLTAPKDGIIAELRAKVGQQVEDQQALVVLGELAVSL